MDAAKELVKARANVNRKVRALQADISESELALVHHFKPIIQPLKEFMSGKPQYGLGKDKASQRIILHKAKEIQSEEPKVKEEEVQTEKMANMIREELFGTEEFSHTPEEEPESEEEYEEEKEKQLHNVTEEGMAAFMEMYPADVKEYIVGLMREPKDFDRTYGVRWHPSENKFTVGNSQIEFYDKMFVINSRKYDATPGIYELLFKKVPHTPITRSDLNVYNQVGQQTNLFRKNYDADAQIQGTTSQKYTSIIKPLLNPHKGTALKTLKFSNKRVEYIPWNNPNHLVNRLRVLMASQAAGHTGHQNEITYIIEELRRSKYIV